MINKQIVVLTTNIIFSTIFQIVKMKTINQFNYPTAQASTYKAYKEQIVQQPKQQQLHYQKVNKITSEQQRNRVKYRQEMKKRSQFQDQQHKIREEIQRKKGEVQELERRMQEALQNQRKAQEMAKLKEVQDRIKKFQDQQRAKENQENAQFRFRDALRRLEAEKQQNATQERQAQQRRKANLEAQKIERIQVNKFKSWQRAKEDEEDKRANEEEKRQFDMMRNGLGRFGMNKPDYSKTCLHNPHMVFKNSQEGPNAFERGQSEQKQRREQQALKKQREEQNRRRSLERGSTAIQKIQREQEYRQYERQTQQEQIQYNMQRIEEGKKHQFIGVKPLTLAQMQQNKKTRGEQQFEDMFLAPEVEVYQQPATKYLIIEKKHPSVDYDTSRQFSSHFDHSIMNKYSDQHKYNQEDEDLEPRQGVMVEPARFKPMAQTRAEEPRPQREELYYSQSEEDSSYP